MTVIAAPAKIDIPAVERPSAGPTVGKETVKVTLANPAKVAVDGVQLLSLTPVPADHTQALKKLSFAGGTFPLKIGTIRPGASASRTFTLDVKRGQGIYQVEALALYDNPAAQGGNARAFAVSDPFEVVRVFAIEGKIQTVGNCPSGSCPAKPLSGATVNATGANGAGQATTSADGTYSIDVANGVYQVTATFQHKQFAPAARTATVKNANARNIDFAACATRDGAPTTDPKIPCLSPVIEVNQVTITSKAIEIHFRGSGWDPKGGPLTFSWGNTTFQTAETASFERSFKIPFWPNRTTMAGAMSGETGNGYCWGELGARQGKSFATSGIVKGKWAGWVLYSSDPNIQARDAWCEGENETFFHLSRRPIVAFGFFGGRGLHTSGVVAYNILAPGEDSPLLVLTSATPINITLPGHRQCLHISGDRNANITISTVAGPCR